MSDTLETFAEIADRYRRRVAAGLDVRLADFARDVEHDLLNVETRLADTGAEIVTAVERVNRSLRDGKMINGLGELQMHAPTFDRLCGERARLTEIVQTLDRVITNIIGSANPKEQQS